MRKSALLALGLLAFAANLAAAPAPKPAQPTGLPKDVHALAPELAKVMDELVRAAEEYRGLRLKRPVPYGALDEKGLQAKVAQALDEDLPPAKLRVLEVSLKAFGLLPETADAAKVYRDILGQQVAAFYDPERKYLAMVERPGAFEALAGRAVSGGGGAEGATGSADDLIAQRAERSILVHELTHAIDDQAFDLERLSKGDPMSDAAAASLALVEGDATLAMYGYLLKQKISLGSPFGKILGEMVGDPDRLAGLAADLPGSTGLTDAPAWFRDTLVFSYLQGFVFCLAVEQHGGQPLLDYAFRHDPPRSTEQLLHPEKWFGRRDDPVRLGWPDLAAALPGWQLAAQGEMGEEGVRILLRQAISHKDSAAAAAGWGGDRFTVYEKEGRRLLLWLTEWDSEADAAELQAAATHLGEGWRVTRSSPTRVVLARGTLSLEAWPAVETALAAARAERPANHGIDFKAPGAAPAR